VYASLIRTLVPLIAGFLITQALRLGIHLDQATVTATVQTLVSAAYYALFRAAEHHLGRYWGWFLGLARPPAYQAGSGTARRLLSRARRRVRPAGGDA